MYKQFWEFYRPMFIGALIIAICIISAKALILHKQESRVKITEESITESRIEPFSVADYRQNALRRLEDQPAKSETPQQKTSYALEIAGLGPVNADK